MVFRFRSRDTNHHRFTKPLPTRRVTPTGDKKKRKERPKRRRRYHPTGKRLPPPSFGVVRSHPRYVLCFMVLPSSASFGWRGRSLFYEINFNYVQTIFVEVKFSLDN